MSERQSNAADPRQVGRALRRFSATHWRAYRSALSHGEPERADAFERRARRYEEIADLCDAALWQPRVTVEPLSPVERIWLGRIFDRLQDKGAREELAEHARRARRDDDKPGSARWVEVALEREADAVRAAPVGDRNNVLHRAAWSLARLSCRGLLSEGDVLEALVPAALAVGLPAREAHSTVRAALRRRCGRTV